MAKISYTVTYDPTYWSFTVTIEDEFNDKQTLDIIKQMVEFWSDWEQRLDENDGDYTMAFLQQLGKEAFLIAVENNYNTVGVVDEFNSREGWYPMDGSMGITIVATDTAEILHSDFSVVKNPDN